MNFSSDVNTNPESAILISLENDSYESFIAFHTIFTV